MEGRSGIVDRRRGLLLGISTVLIGMLYRVVMAKVMFLQADEEIFSYDAYYFVLGRSFEFLMKKIGAYIGYPFLLSIWFRIFGASLFSARLFSVSCMGLVLFFAYLTLLRITKDIRISVTGALILALLPFPLRYGHMALSEPLAWVFISLSFYLITLAVKDGKWYMFLLSGLSAAPAVAVRRSALILPLVLFPALVWINRNSFKKIIKESLTWLGGFFIPVCLGFMGFVLYFGWDRLKDLRFTRVPQFTVGSTFENAFYTLHPVSWKGATLVILLLFGSAILLMSLFRDRWKVAYGAAFLWPAFMRIALGSEGLSQLEMARLMVIPVVVLFARDMYTGRRELYTSIAILFGGAVAFSTISLTGDIWNVIIYSSAGALMLLYLHDRIDSIAIRWSLLIGGMALLVIICSKEPQIMNVVMAALSVGGMCISLSIPSMEKPSQGLVITILAMTIPLLWFSDVVIPLAFIAGLVIASMTALIILSVFKRRIWAISRYFPVLASLGFLLLVPDSVPAWGIYLPVIGMVIFDLAPILRLDLLKKMGDFIPATGFVLAFGLAWFGSSDLMLSLFSAVMVGAASSGIMNASGASVLWGKKIGFRMSVVLFMLVVGYLAFYVYYSWTEVYLTELILQSSLIGGLLLWVMFSTTKSGSTTAPGKGKFSLRSLTGNRQGSSINRMGLAIFLTMITISIPISISSFLESDWFVEEPMDQRPYMRTIEDVALWLEENTDDNEPVLAWHCYAVQADRETIIDTSNAKRYDGDSVIGEMEERGVDVFVRCFYTDHGLWKDQPRFQMYVRSNFHIERIIDGNECWIRNGV